MKQKRIIFSSILLFFTLSIASQVKDISVTVSPMLEHTWWDNKLSFDNTVFYGGRAGFSFGPILEIRGFYQKSMDVKASLRELNWDVTTDWAEKITNSYVDMSRYGGEFKFNLVKNSIFSPYITLGAGVQDITFELESSVEPGVMFDMKEEQLFVALGLGTKINLSDRIVLSLEAKNTAFNANETSYYLNPDFEYSDKNKRLRNWSALASLDFYLGGVGNNNPTAVSEAYRTMFSDGFSGMKFVLEPGGTYVDFHSDSKFANQYFLGGSAGFDFSSLVGIRGFYYQATEDPEKISSNLNKQLSMYGGNIIARLNQPRGVTPYLMLGGGYLKVGEEYIDKFGTNTAQSAPFAFGGLGLEIPLSKYAALYGTVNAMFMSENDGSVIDIQNTEQVKRSMAYQAGVRFNIGQSIDAKKAENQIFDRNTIGERSYRNARINEMAADYKARIEALNDELDIAVQNNDMARASQIVREKKRLENNLAGIIPQNELPLRSEGLSSAEYESLVSRIMEEVRTENAKQLERIESRMPLQSNSDTLFVPSERPAAPTVQPQQQPTDAMQREASAQTRMLNETLSQQAQRDNLLISQLADLNAKLDRNFEQAARQPEVVPAPAASTNRNVGRDIVTAGALSRFFARNKSQGTKNKFALIGGIGFGDSPAWNLGMRSYLKIGNTPLDLMPEAYVAIGEKLGFGISINAIYNLRIRKFTPYAGFGVGVFPGEETHAGTNFILGTGYDVVGGGFFIDYSVRSVFKQNQLAIGYRFSF